MNFNSEKYYTGLVVDICDNIVSVSGLSKAFSGELVRFKNTNSDIRGFV
jgi:F0F1-type ATP synthase alpha subunit